MIKPMFLPLIKKYIQKLLSISLLLAIGIMLFIGLVSTYSSVKASSSDYFNRYQLPKMTISTTDFTDIPSLTASSVLVDCRYVADCKIITSGDAIVTGRCFFESAQSLKSRYKAIGELEKSNTMLNAFLDISLARYKHLETGDILNISSPFGSFSVNICGLTTTPENLVSSRDSLNNFDLENFGCVYLDYDEIASFFHLSEKKYNQILLDREDSDGVLLSELKKDYTVLSSTSFSTSPQLQIIESNLKPIRTLCFVFPPIIFLITIFISVLFMVQIIRAEHREISMLRAFGYAEEKIANLFTAMGLFVSSVASVFGLLFGHILGVFISNVYFTRFFFPSKVYVNPRPVYLIAVAVALFFGLIMSVASGINIRKIEPSDAFSIHSVPQHQEGNRKLSLCSEMVKAQLRFSFRHESRTLISISGIALTGILLYIAFSFISALNTVKFRTIETRYNFDAMVCLNRDVPEEHLSSLFSDVSQITSFEPAAYKAISLSKDGETAQTTLFAVNPDSEMIHLEDKEGKPVTIPRRGIVLEYHTAKKLKASVGDTVMFEGTALLVTAISYQDVVYLQYISIAQMEALNGGAAINCALVRERPDTDSLAFSSAVSKLDEFRYVTYTKSVEKGIRSRANSSIIAVIILLICGFLIGLIVVSNISLINFKDRRHILAVAVCMGISRFRISASVCAEFLFEYLVAIGITGLVGINASSFLLEKLAVDSMSFRNLNPAGTFLQVAVLVFLYIFLANCLILLRIRKTNLAKALQEAD